VIFEDTQGDEYLGRGIRDGGDAVFIITAPSFGVITVSSVARQTVTPASGAVQTAIVTATADGTVIAGGAL